MNLTEQWKNAYIEYLAEEEASISNDADAICEELSAA